MDSFILKKRCKLYCGLLKERVIMLAKQQKKKNQSSSAQFIIICVVYLNACFYRERLLQVGDHTPQNCLILWGSLAHKTSQGSEVRINLILEAA